MIEQLTLLLGQSIQGPQMKVRIYRLLWLQQIATSVFVSQTEVSPLSLQYCRSYSDLSNTSDDSVQLCFLLSHGLTTQVLQSRQILTFALSTVYLHTFSQLHADDRNFQIIIA